MQKSSIENQYDNRKVTQKKKKDLVSLEKWCTFAPSFVKKELFEKAVEKPM